MLVFPDYDLKQAVNYAAFSAFIGAGQTCVCGSRHIVHKDLYEQFVQELAAKARAIRVGDPTVHTTQMGPLISEKQRQRVMNYVRIGQDEGARLVAGGKIPEHLRESEGFFIQPTVFADVAPEMRIFQEEVFGPFTSVTPFSTEDEAVELANNSPFGLAAAIRTLDVARAHRVASRIKCGSFGSTITIGLIRRLHGGSRTIGHQAERQVRILRKPFRSQECNDQRFWAAVRLV